MRRYGPIAPQVKFRIFFNALRHSTVLVSSGDAQYVVPKSKSRSEFDGLMKEIDHLWTSRGCGQRKLRVSASKLQSAPMAPTPKKTTAALATSPSLPPPPAAAAAAACASLDHPRSSSSFLAIDQGSPITPTVTMRVASNLSDIACTLQELEGTLFQLSANESSISDSQEDDMRLSGAGMRVRKDNDDHGGHGSDKKTAAASIPDSPEKLCQTTPTPSVKEHISDPLNIDRDEGCELFSCWSDATDVEPTDKGTFLRLSSSLDRTFTLRLVERPRSIRTIIVGVRNAITEVESLVGPSSDFSIVFCTAPGVPFFTALDSELEFAPLSRLELFMEKEGLFGRIKAASARGASFTAELSGSALDFGAELLFMCDRVVLQNSCAPNMRVGFPSLQLGVWPSPHILQCVALALGSTKRTMVEIPFLHKLVWGDVQLKYPELLRTGRDSLHRQTRNKNALWSTLQLWQKKVRDFLAWDVTTLPSTEGTVGGVLWDRWADYCAAAGLTDVEDAATIAVRSLDVYAALLGTSESCNAAAMAGVLRRMHRRVLTPPPPPPPHDGYVDVQPHDPVSATRGAPFWVFRDGCSPATVQFISRERACSGCKRMRSALLIGQPEALKEAVELLDCAVVATSLRPPKLPDLGEGEMMEVQLLRTSNVSNENRKMVLSSALAYLQSKKIPYVLTRGGDAGNRLVAALTLELCRLAAETDVHLIEQVARESLGFRVSPFQLLDHYGAKHLSAVMERHQHMTKGRNVTSVARTLLSTMVTEGFGGDHSFLGSFYGKNGQLNRGALRPMVRTRCITRNDVLLRLLAVLVNESCRMLLEGCVDRVEDINLVSICTLTMSLPTGGLLSCVDNRVGFLTLLHSMEYLSRDVGAIDPPSPLLLSMRTVGETFRTLSTDSLQRARRNL